MRSTRSIEILCLALAALVLVWSKALTAHFWPVIGLLATFAALILGFRARLFLPGRTRVKLLTESWSMVAFVGGVVWFTGKSDSALLNLYLLPIILSALTLGRLNTMLQVAAVAACYVLVAAVSPGHDVLSLGFASRAVGVLAPILLVAYLTSTLAADITDARQRIERLAHHDPLTGLFNQRSFTDLWRREHEARERLRAPYAVLMVDIDHLDRVNEEFGREAGDSALTLVAKCLLRSIRNTDRAARNGGDEFAVLLPGATADMADAVVKRIRNNVYKTTLELRSRMIRCTVSVGIANYPQDAREVRELQSIAEHRMYRDKELRRAPGSTEKA
ncbi:MAG: diguanylate cyclase [Gammaproteobacteria bacterium]|nr:diguanylate cyclase [Gammaproteobacteria bacterium]MDE2347326.1 diguanylate cyclase [Gammaproteobacteria bacterium]